MESNINPDLPNKILDGLYLGSVDESKNKKALKEIGIRYILTVGAGLDMHHPKVFSYITQDFKYYRIELEDMPSEPIEQYFDASYQ
jgi:hypothetical protein